MQRDCYAASLDRNNVPRDKISRMLGHSNVVITEHYPDGLDPDDTFGNNKSILYALKNPPENPPEIRGYNYSGKKCSAWSIYGVLQ